VQLEVSDNVDNHLESVLRWQISVIFRRVQRKIYYLHI
jgi:hypothetical protein